MPEATPYQLGGADYDAIAFALSSLQEAESGETDLVMEMRLWHTISEGGYQKRKAPGCG
jgi:hypothetical protein